MGSRLLEREAGIPTREVPQVPPPSSENIHSRWKAPAPQEERGQKCPKVLAVVALQGASEEGPLGAQAPRAVCLGNA